MSTARLVEPDARGRLDQAPDRIAGEPCRQEEEERFAERLVGNRPQSPRLVLGLAARAERELEREDPDDAVDDTAGRQADARGDLQRAALRLPAGGAPRVPLRPRGNRDGGSGGRRDAAGLPGLRGD